MVFMMLQLCQANSSEGGHVLWKCLQIVYHRSLGLTMSIRFPTPRPRGANQVWLPCLQECEA